MEAPLTHGEHSHKTKACLSLFLTFMRISCFVLGGGFAIVPVVQDEYVRKRRLITEGEFADLFAIIQISPGLMVANCAVYVGNKIAGFWGGISAILGAALPPVVTICLIARCFQEIPVENPIIQSTFVGIRAAVCGLIFATAWRMRKTVLISRFAQILTLGALVCLMFKVNPAAIILGCAAIGMLKQVFYDAD